MIITQHLASSSGPVIAASDYIRAYADQVRGYVPRSYRVLGTDGYGRSDGREKLRSFFEVDRYHVVIAALAALVAEGELEHGRVAEAMAKYGVDPDRPAPMGL